MFGQRNTTMKAQSWLRHSVTNSSPQSGYTSSARLVSQSSITSPPSTAHPHLTHQSTIHQSLGVGMSFDSTSSPFKTMTLNMQPHPASPTLPPVQQARIQNTIPITVQNPLKATKSLQTQASTIGLPSVASKDAVYHKKLDRSFSEPAERKCSAAAAAQIAAQQQQQQNGSVSTRYKTELCRSFVESGACKYGEKCQFAHGNDELRAITRHPKFKTENCRRFHTVGFCPYGPRCHFIHNGDEEQRKFALRYSSSIGSTGSNPSTNSSSIGSAVGNGNSAFASAAASAASFFSDSSSPTSPSSGSATFRPVSNYNSVEPLDSLLVRPKALSFGSTSLGSSGEISTASSSSQSPTSLGSFFNDFDSMFNAPSMQSAFSVSPDSFGKFSPWNAAFGGSVRSLKPDEANSDIPDSLLFNLVGGANASTDLFTTEKSFFDHYPAVPVSPSVDSVNSELEALKISPGSNAGCGSIGISGDSGFGASSGNGSESGYSPISAFSPAGTSPTGSSTSPAAFNRYDSFFSTPASTAGAPGSSVCSPRSRLPTFAKFSTNAQQ